MANGGGNGGGVLPQKVVEILLAVALALASYVGWSISASVTELRRDVADFRASVPNEYVRKKDYQKDLDRIYRVLEAIDRKLDQMNRRAGNGP